MISNLLSRYMIDKITTQKTPTVNEKKCINKRQKRLTCDTCVRCCKQQAISLDNDVKINEEACLNCGVCGSVCPTGAIIQSFEVVEKQVHAVQKSSSFILSCNHEENPTDLKVECLAAIPWEFYAYLAITHPITVVIRTCQTCEHKDLCQEVEKILNRLEVFMGEHEFLKKVNIMNEEGELPVAHYSRRDLLKLFSEESKRLATDIIPINFEENKNPRIYRHLLINKIKHESELLATPTYGWSGISVNENCWGCGVCAQVCPQNAISVRTNEAGQHTNLHDYAKCTHCQICQIVCLKQAINLEIKQGDVENTITESRVKMRLCQICKEPLMVEEADVCILCERKQNPIL